MQAPNKPSCFWKLLRLLSQALPPPPSTLHYLNLVSKPCSQEASHAAAAEGRCAEKGGVVINKGTAFPGSSCEAMIRKAIFKVKMKRPGCSEALLILTSCSIPEKDP